MPEESLYERFCPFCKTTTTQVKQEEFKVMTVYGCLVCHTLNWDEPSWGKKVS